MAVTDPEEDQSGDVVVTGVPVDQRIRLRPKLMEGNKYPFFGDENSVLHMLNETNGVFFPYTPTITTGNSASYSTMTPTHANTDYYSYTNSPAVKIQINGQFSAQNLSEARYTLAAMHFFRSATKMRFGEKDDNRGQPPPILVLTGYGDFMFNTLDVILTDFTMELPNDVDYLEVRIGDILSWVPSLVTFGVTCVVQQSPRQQKQEFSLDEFISGELFKGGLRGWI
ncbi:MAG: hypothetical protein EOO77_36785 [Oxalobacteraceae bacterium]|nr:MAG: hypothetical protein EOO77_36785 [Oxalobacteraceae bacterium]